MLSGQTTVSRLHALIVENDLKEIQVYRFDDNKLHNRSHTWSFGHEFIEVGINRTI